MAGQLFDFDKYYTEKSLKTELHLDLSGINLKSSGSNESQNEDGTADSVDMNQYITNNVMYKISQITYQDMPLDLYSKIRIVITNTNGTSDTIYTSVGYPIDDLVAAGLAEIPESMAAMSPFTVSSGTLSDGRTLRMDWIDETDSIETLENIQSIKFYVVPRVRLENPYMNNVSARWPYYLNPTDSNYENVDQSFSYMYSNPGLMACCLGALGFSGKRMLSNKWYKKALSGKNKAVFKYDTFKKRLKYVAEHLKDSNFGINVTYYDDNYADDADWTQTGFSKNAKYKDLYTESNITYFSNLAISKGVMPDMVGSNATALIPNMADAVKAFFYDSDQLSDDFTDQYFSTISGILSMPGVGRFLSSSMKSKLRAESKKLKVSGSSSGTTPTYAIDLSSFVKMGVSMSDDNKISIPGAIKTNCIPRAISTYNEYVAIASRQLLNGKYSMYVESYPIDYLVSYKYGPSKWPVMYYKQTADRYSNPSDTTYKDWVISTEEKTGKEIKEYLCEVYTDLYNKKHDLADDDEGYTVWTYENGILYATVKYKANSSDKFLTTAKLVVSTSGNVSTAGSIPSVSSMEKYAKEKTDVPYEKSTALFIAICTLFINAFKDNAVFSASERSSTSLVDQRLDLSDTETYNCIQWSSSASVDDNIDYTDEEPLYKTIDNFGDASDYDIDDCVDFFDTLGEAIDEIDTSINKILATAAIMGSSALLALVVVLKVKLSDIKDDYADLKETVKRIKWYQRFTTESVFDNLSFIGTRGAGDDDSDCYSRMYLYMPARFLVPVEMYKKVRVKYKLFGITRHKMVKKSIGVRWAEVTIVDNNVYAAYPTNSNQPRQFYLINKYASVSIENNNDGTGAHYVFTFDEELEGDTSDKIETNAITQFTQGDLQFISSEGYEYSVTFSNSKIFTSVDSDLPFKDGDHVLVYGIYVPLEPTSKSDELTKVHVEYDMPYLPYDSEIERWAFLNYGPFDQDKFADQSREVPADGSRIDGWRIFNRSSKRIFDMRASMGIYDAVAILTGILKNTYGSSRVDVVETMRSLEDQEIACSGDAESKFLSWHNYGLAVKILITDTDTKLPIEDGSDDMKKLIDIAEAFTTACYNGAFGKPLNVVWCGRLAVGANIFVWEFLPIGVTHKDAPQFREEYLNQTDPVATLGYVDVDENGYVYDSKPDENVPYVLSGSSTYKNAIQIGGHHYVSPSMIRNYSLPKDLVLRNILEFVKLIDTKMGANGSTLTNRASMYEWKALNDRSYKQLIMYFAMTGNVAAAKTLIGGEYVETYQNIIDSKYSEDFVQMVKDYLGTELYNSVKIYIDSVGDGGAWLSLSDGKLHIKVMDIIPNYNMNSKDHFFGEKKMTQETMLRGKWLNGVFYTEEELNAMNYQLETVSTRAYIDGIDSNGNVTGGDAMLIHSLIATQIKNEFDKIKEQFENYGGSLMYDHFADGPNAEMSNMLENEFGIIDAQDLISFDKLRSMYNIDDINANASISSDGTVNGIGDADIYEKVVSNAQLAGVRKASLTKEHVEVNARSNGTTVEQLYKIITQGRGYKANDILKH